MKKLFDAQVVGQSFENGNMSWARKQVGKDLHKFVEVFKWLRENNPSDAERWLIVVGGN